MRRYGAEPGGSSLAPYEFETTAVDPSGAITARRKGFARYYVENINGVSLDMVLIPEGSFRMGSSGYTPENQSTSQSLEVSWVRTK